MTPQAFNRSTATRYLSGVFVAAALLFSTAGEGRAGIHILDENAKPGSAFTTGKTPQKWLLSAIRDWMAALPDNTALNTISIPGTHDSGALHGGVYAQTQSWSIAEQLNAGIRYLDVRARRTKTSFAIHHGMIYQKQMFGNVMNAVVGFLRAHPKETVLMRVKEEHTPEGGSKSFGWIWGNYMKRYGAYVWRGNNRLPTLGQVRGKVLVLRNQGEIPSSYGVNYGSNTIQDQYKVLPHTMSKKKNLVKGYIRKAQNPTNGKLVLNHLSGTNIPLMPPRAVAKATNNTAYAYIGPYRAPRKLGVLILDFPGDRLVYRIIKTNLSTSKTCSPKTYRSVSQHSWVEFRMPKAPIGFVIGINGGAYNKYVFPKCNRVWWNDLSFMCQTNGTWKRTKGKWGADALCHGSKGKSPYVKVGNR